ncbi:ankyrin repeat and MYND domain-containing protein 2 [Ischnura elegans]|uniref:ankyrin repeat and MYND domain-containing protein 2 n=1 Tax=Ischnura elegans TaxID=197161 RepID=UPI001ED895B7|nr:ankyrin repeat and MYND domain-containing protein 2 [Ischnura elegans]
MASEKASTEGSNMEKALFEKLAAGDVEGVKNILLLNEIDINCVDENGMTPLQHVCYKGNKEYVQMLLDRGADVNAGKHESAYTALHFAALSGNVEVCHMLLAAGAKTHTTNSVGRTASQMAAFVGNHSCVAVINNFVPQSVIDYYTQPHDLETEPKLLPIMSSPLHKLVMQVNINPVRVALSVQKVPALLENIPSACKVLDLMSEKEMKKGQETNEVLSFKFHYLSFILNAIEKCKPKVPVKKGENEGACRDPIEVLVRKLLQTNASGVPDYQEKLLRECIRCFPYREGTLLRQMVACLAHEASGCDSALSVIATGINGHQMGRQVRSGAKEGVCETCGDWDKACKACSRCKEALYCGKECQRLHWFVHKRTCKPAPLSSEASQVTTGSATACESKAEALGSMVAGVEKKMEELECK